jgi:hypothetical protein
MFTVDTGSMKGLTQMSNITADSLRLLQYDEKNLVANTSYR